MNLGSDLPFPNTGCPLASLGAAIGREEQVSLHLKRRVAVL